MTIFGYIIKVQLTGERAKRIPYLHVRRKDFKWSLTPIPTAAHVFSSIPLAEAMVGYDADNDNILKDHNYEIIPLHI